MVHELDQIILGRGECVNGVAMLIIMLAAGRDLICERPMSADE